MYKFSIIKLEFSKLASYFLVLSCFSNTPPFFSFQEYNMYLDSSATNTLTVFYWGIPIVNASAFVWSQSFFSLHFLLFTAFTWAPAASALSSKQDATRQTSTLVRRRVCDWCLRPNYLVSFPRRVRQRYLSLKSLRVVVNWLAALGPSCGPAVKRASPNWRLELRWPSMAKSYRQLRTVGWLS